jgi:putative DNA primase/helicase
MQEVREMTQQLAPAPTAVTQDDKPAQREIGMERFSDAYLADQFANEELLDKYVWADGLGWMRWTGKVWEEVSDAHMIETLRKWTVGVYQKKVDAYAKKLIDEKELDEWRKLLNQRKQDSVFRLTRGIVEKTASDFDSNPDVLNTPNGIVSLKTGGVLAHNPQEYCTKITSGNYIPGFTHPDWTSALEAMHGDVAYWYQSFVGQGITGYHDNSVVPILQGGGANGKSALSTDSLIPALGDYAYAASSKLLGGSQSSISNEKAELRGRRLVIVEELTEGRSIDVGALKSIMDVGTITARKLYANNITFKTSHTVLATTNYRPVVSETDHGTWRRLALVTFPFTYLPAGEPLIGLYDRRGDELLKSRIKQGNTGQHDAIVTWAVEGAVRHYQWQEAKEIWEVTREGDQPVSPLKVIGRIEVDTRSWRSEADRILGLWEEHLVPDPNGVVESTELLNYFNAQLEEAGHKPWSKETFASKFLDHTESQKHRILKKKMRKTTAEKNLSRPQWFGQRAELKETGHYYEGLRFRNHTDDDE